MSPTKPPLAAEVEVEVDPDRLLRGIAEASRRLIDLEDAYEEIMNRCLEVVGDALEVDRVYIFEAHRGADGRSLCSQRFEWTRGSVNPEINNPELQDLPFTDLHDWETHLRAREPVAFVVADYPDRGVRELLQAQSIIAILVVPIHLRGEFWGFIGFDDCARRRRWREAELLALTALAGSIGGALVRTRTHRTMLDLSTPILQIWRGLLAVPIIGRLTRERAARLTETLLIAIRAQGAREVILDITGMSAIADRELTRLVQTIRAARLLGARCTLVGTSAAVAQTLVDAEVDLAGIELRSRLGDRLAELLTPAAAATP